MDEQKWLRGALLEEVESLRERLEIAEEELEDAEYDLKIARIIEEDITDAREEVREAKRIIKALEIKIREKLTEAHAAFETNKDQQMSKRSRKVK